MFEYLLLTLTLLAIPVADPSVKPDPVRGCATCIRPVAQVAPIPAHCATQSIQASDSQAIGGWLSAWEQSTQTIPPRSRSEQEELRHKIHTQFNEHAAAAVEQFVGRIQASRMFETFAWQVVEINSQRIRLDAIPRDDMECLFYTALRITLDASNGHLTQVEIVGRNLGRHVVWQANHQQLTHPVEWVRLESHVPPAPDFLIRTADVRVEN